MYVCRCPDGSGDDWVRLCDELHRTNPVEYCTRIGVRCGTTKPAFTFGYRHHQLHTAERGKCQLLVDGTSGNDSGIILEALSKSLIPKFAPVSVIAGSCWEFSSLSEYIPFRAPIVTKLYSFDRFLLLRGWVPAINLILITLFRIADSNGTPFLKRFRTRKRGNPRTVLCRHNPRIHYLLFARLFFLKEKTLRLVIIGIG